MSNLSIQAYIKAMNDPRMVTKKAHIYRALLLPLTLNELKAATKISHQTLTARLSELMDEGLVFEAQSGKFHQTDIEMVEMAANARANYRYEKWVKLGNDNGYFERVISEKRFASYQIEKP